MLTVKTIWCLQIPRIILNVASAPSPATANSLTHCDSWSVGLWEKNRSFLQIWYHFLWVWSRWAGYSGYSFQCIKFRYLQHLLPPKLNLSSHSSSASWLLQLFPHTDRLATPVVTRPTGSRSISQALPRVARPFFFFPAAVPDLPPSTYWWLLEAEEVLTGHHCVQITLSFHHLTHQSW